MEIKEAAGMIEEAKTLEHISKEEFELLPLGRMAGSEREDLLVIKTSVLYWEIFSLANFRGEPGKSRYVCITYNDDRLGKIFGAALHGYVNFLVPGDTAGNHFHKDTSEIFYVTDNERGLAVKLKNPETGEKAQVELDAKLVEFEGKLWYRSIIIPSGIAHAVHNPNDQTVCVNVLATKEHGTEDAFRCET